MHGLEIASASDPIELFRVWLSEAEAHEANDPNAAALATASREGMPNVRMVLVKRVDERGFAFYTNAESRKGVELAENPCAAMCFHWKSMRRQVRISGSVAELPPEDADEYFQSRSRLSQLGAAASRQSRVLASREVLETQVHALEEEFPGRIPRPEYWRGYALLPERIEFWQDGAGRLHDRFLFVRSADGWKVNRLYP
jgi:pyridoxamine 5'-phosphate oxidase